MEKKGADRSEVSCKSTLSIMLSSHTYDSRFLGLFSGVLFSSVTLLSTVVSAIEFGYSICPNKMNTIDL